MTLSFAAFLILLLVVVFVIDDLFIDAVAFIKKLGPKELKPSQIDFLKSLPEKRIAIIIANWHEANVIGRMITGNLKNVDYKNFRFYLGVYPNDPETLQAAQNLMAVYPDKVHVIVNSKDGPTSKGQMLNELVRGVITHEETLGSEHEVFVMHDSEDILHPLSLKVINGEITRADFIQTPVFSFDRPCTQWVGSVYIDEFSEIHTKDLFVREALGAPVPSAGTGTALHRRLVLSILKANNGDFLREDTLTEDYVLGMSSSILGFKTSFVCYFIRNGKVKEFISTREYFPAKMGASVRQKTRWILGISFQGWKMIPWKGTWAHKYFLYRDRRSPFNNAVAMATAVLTAYLLSYPLFYGEIPAFLSEKWFLWGTVIATAGALSRLYHRLKAVILVNGWKKAWAVFVRWPVGIWINFVASMKALTQYQRARLKKEPLKWTKTTHELPEGFGELNP